MELGPPHFTFVELGPLYSFVELGPLFTFVELGPGAMDGEGFLQLVLITPLLLLYSLGF